MTETSTLAFRKAVPEDARALVAFRVRALKEDCREFLPQHALDDVARRPATLAAPRATVPAVR